MFQQFNISIFLFQKSLILCKHKFLVGPELGKQKILCRFLQFFFRLTAFILWSPLSNNYKIHNMKKNNNHDFKKVILYTLIIKQMSFQKISCIQLIILKKKQTIKDFKLRRWVILICKESDKLFCFKTDRQKY